MQRAPACLTGIRLMGANVPSPLVVVIVVSASPFVCLCTCSFARLLSISLSWHWDLQLMIDPSLRFVCIVWLCCLLFSLCSWRSSYHVSYFFLLSIRRRLLRYSNRWWTTRSTTYVRALCSLRLLSSFSTPSLLHPKSRTFASCTPKWLVTSTKTLWPSLVPFSPKESLMPAVVMWPSPSSRAPVTPIWVPLWGSWFLHSTGIGSLQAFAYRWLSHPLVSSDSTRISR